MSDAERQLKPANENPWYVLMTLFGVPIFSPSEDLKLQNGFIWNTWACQKMSVDERKKIAHDLGINPELIGNWKEIEKDVQFRFAQEWASRNERGLKRPPIPSPDENIQLSAIDFTSGLYAQNAIFPSEVSFSHSRISHMCTFSRAIFLKEALFSQTKFRGASSFSGTFFHSETTFTDSNFAQGVSFHGANFAQRANFGKARFEKQAFFSEATVGGLAQYDEAEFQGDAKFNAITFNDSANFRSTVFFSEAHFGQTSFEKGAIFDNAEFRERILFTQIKSNAGFELRNGVVKKDFIFDGSHVSGLSDFSSSSFSGFASFAECQFEQKHMEEKCGWVLFNECQFEKPTSFRMVSFSGCFPEFGGAVLHLKTTFSAQSDLWPIRGHQIASEARESFATIRHVVGKQGLPEDEHFFFRKEMHFASQIGSYWQRLPYRFFGLVSDYGHSIIRPTIGLFALWLIPMLCYMIYFNWIAAFGGMEGQDVGMFDSVSLSFTSMFKFLGLQRLHFGADYIQALPPFLEFLTALQTLGGIILLFFLGLGLRTRFRLR